jgi:hypothetical protein
MKKILTALLSSLLLGGMTTASAAEAPETASDLYNYYGEITYTCMDAAVIEDNSIIGEVIGGGSIVKLLLSAAQNIICLLAVCAAFICLFSSFGTIANGRPPAYFC